MELKKSILNVLKSLKEQGLGRRQLEEKLGYSEKYIDQALSRGGNADLLSQLQMYQSGVLRDATVAGATTDKKGKDKHIDQDLTMQALVNLTESNRLQAESLKSMSRSHEELVMMLKAQRSTIGDVDQQNFADTVNTVLGLRELLTEFVSQVSKKPLVEVQNDLNKKVKAVKVRLGNTGIAADGRN